MENQKGSVRSQGQLTKAASLRRIKNIIAGEAKVLSQKPPSLFQIILLNDGATPIGFVTQSLQEHFYKPHNEAATLAKKIQQDGEGVCGHYTREIAETKIAEVIEAARSFSHPLKCVMRKVK